MDIGLQERFAIIRKETGQNTKDFAASLGMESTTVSSIESGKREPSKKVLCSLSSKFAVNLNWLLTGEGELFLQKQENFLETAYKTKPKQIPIYNESELPEGAFIVPLLDQRLSAGNGSYLPEEDKSTALIRVPAYLSRYGDKVAALTVDGDSMYPTLSRGDMVVCDSCGWSGEGIYALRMNGSGYVKRITKRPGKVVIISDNPKYPSMEEPEGTQDIEIIGRVHCAIKQVE